MDYLPAARRSEVVPVAHTPSQPAVTRADGPGPLVQLVAMRMRDPAGHQLPGGAGAPAAVATAVRTHAPGSLPGRGGTSLVSQRFAAAEVVQRVVAEDDGTNANVHYVAEIAATGTGRRSIA